MPVHVNIPTSNVFEILPRIIEIDDAPIHAHQKPKPKKVTTIKRSRMNMKSVQPAKKVGLEQGEGSVEVIDISEQKLNTQRHLPGRTKGSQVDRICALCGFINP